MPDISHFAFADGEQGFVDAFQHFCIGCERKLFTDNDT